MIVDPKYLSELERENALLRAALENIAAGLNVVRPVQYAREKLDAIDCGRQGAGGTRYYYTIACGEAGMGPDHRQEP